jgi:hypothetical protein
MAMLLAALLYREGYGVALLHFEEERHVALGLETDGEGFKGTGHIFVETTGFAYVSEVPESFVGLDDEDIVLESVPFVYTIGERPIADRQPNFSEAALADIARILDVRYRADAAADQRFRHIERTPMSQAEFNRQRRMYENCFVAMNEFRATVCDDGYCDGVFRDRSCAIEWIDQFAWWE